MYDTIIIGAGPAGLTAAIYAARAKLSFLILSEDTGGLITWAPKVENFPGIPNVSGQELADRLHGHLDWFKVSAREESVSEVSRKENHFAVKTESRNYETRTIVICSGSRPRKLQAKGAAEFEGKGIAYCATCDGPLYANRTVAVVGGGDSALGTALMLSKICKKVYLLNNKNELTGTDKGMKNAVLSNERISVLNNVEITEITGGRSVTGVKIREAVASRSIALEGIFVAIGHARNVEFLKGIAKLNAANEIIVDKTGMTSAAGIFAAGDVTDMPGKQAVISCGDGARAMLSAVNHIQKGGH